MSHRDDWYTFLFENSNGKLYEVTIDHAGVGVGRLQGTKVNTSPSQQLSLTETALTVDGASLVAWRAYHVSRKTYAAVYNTAQDLDTLLNAA
jgi:hypothetical protein